ncbi:iron chelate uptake ABC transporter family permease subunit [Olivibacter sitiensis]|uniref:iron chelate uptake ABC transporter family permease subunit n=1 Tax=Olivibacter sitiensis TaxID=376470 RepID=UPI0003F5DCF6|nr:iron chelate uptake ABC transporter family permease subunit [Olivibacter sitiensis]
MRQKYLIPSMVFLLLVVATLFVFYNTGKNLDFVLPRRLIRLATMLVVGISVAYSSIIFQTITNNRILTPAIMGYESIFILFQTILVFFYGDRTFQAITQEENFFYAVVLMMGFSVFMYVLIFGKAKRNIYQLLLVGVVLGALFQTLGQFIQIVIDPNEFSIVQNFMFVSFTKMNTQLLLIASITLLVSLVYVHRYLKYLDVISLGRDIAVNLGLDYEKLIRKFMLVIAVLVSVSTALVGPITFLGILVANLTYELCVTKKHRLVVVCCSLLSCLFLVVGQFLVEHVFNFSTNVTIVINFVGGLYFMYLIFNSRKRI